MDHEIEKLEKKRPSLKELVESGEWTLPVSQSEFWKCVCPKCNQLRVCSGLKGRYNCPICKTFNQP